MFIPKLTSFSSLLHITVLGALFGFTKIAWWPLPDAHGIFGSILGILVGIAFYLVIARCFAALLHIFNFEDTSQALRRARTAFVMLAPIAFTPANESLAKAWLIAICSHAALIYAIWPFIQYAIALVRGLNVQARTLFFAILFFGFVAKIIVASVTSHGDTITMVDMVHESYTSPFTVYEQSRAARSNANRTVYADYFPASFLYFGAIHALYGPLFSGSMEPGWENGPNAHRYITFTKLSYLGLDLAIAFLLMAILTPSRRGLVGFSLWWLNPVVWFGSYTLGQFDLLIAFFLLMACALAEKQRSLGAALFSGVAALVKLVPLGLIVLLAADEKRNTQRLKIIAAGIGIFLAGVAVFTSSETFMNYVLFGTETPRIWQTQLDLFPPYRIPLFFVACCILGYLIWERRKSLGAANIFALFGAAFITLVPVNPQWVIWLLSAFILVMVRHERAALMIPFALGFLLTTMQIWPKSSLFYSASSYLAERENIQEFITFYTDPAYAIGLGFGAMVFVSVMIVLMAASPKRVVYHDQHPRSVLVVLLRVSTAVLATAAITGLLIESVPKLQTVSGPVITTDTATETVLTFPPFSGKVYKITLESMGFEREDNFMLLERRRSGAPTDRALVLVTRASGNNVTVQLKRGMVVTSQDQLTLLYPSTLQGAGASAKLTIGSEQRVPLFDKLAGGLQTDRNFGYGLVAALGIFTVLGCGLFNRHIVQWLEKEPSQLRQAA